tara:strand:+ start:279 stop:1325 length:1047 start_codon:yes stop_codon:yes gene_type:complete
MASTYTTNLKLTKQADGENPNSWGQILNDGVISLLDDAIAGYTTITLGAAATVTLTNNQGSGDQARSAILEFKGSVGGSHNDIVVLIPNNSKSYIVKNSVSYTDDTDSVVLRVAGNTGATLKQADTALYVTNGTTVTPAASNTFNSITTSVITVSTSAMFVDNAKLNIGTGSDLQVYHDGSNSYIDDAGTGSLYLRSNELQVHKYTGEVMATFTADGAVNIYYDNGVKLATNTNGVQITGTLLATTDTDTSNTGSVTLDFAANQNFVLTLTGNLTLANPTTEQVGQAGVITFIQDGTGSRTLTLGTQYKTRGGSGITLSTAANTVDVVPYFVQSSGNILLGAVQKAFS